MVTAGSSSSNFEKLPREIAELIFDYSDLTSVLRLRGVSRQLNRVVLQYIQSIEQLRLSRLASNDSAVVDSSSIAWLFSRIEWRSLRLLHFDGMSADFEPIHCGNFPLIFASCPRLESLIVEVELFGSSPGWFDEPVRSKARCLRYFRWCGFHNRCGKRFEKLIFEWTSPWLIVAHVHSLPTIGLTALRQLVLERWPSFASGNLQQAWSRMPLLESLVVYHGSRSNAVRHLSAISSSCLHLTELSAIACDLQDRDLSVLRPMFCRLKSLDLFYNYSITDRAMASFSGSTTFEHVGLNCLFEISGKSLLSLTNNSPALQRLAVCGCQKLDTYDIALLLNDRIASNNIGPCHQTNAVRPLLTIYAQNTKIDVSFFDREMLRQAKVNLITQVDPSKPIVTVPLWTPESH